MNNILLKNKVITGMLANIVGQGLMMLTMIILARSMSLQDYGIFRYLFIIGTFLSFILICGRDNLIVICSQKGSTENDDIGSHFFSGFIQIILIGIALSVISQQLTIESISNKALLLTCAMIVLWALTNLILSVLKGQVGVMYVQYVQNLFQRALRFILIIFMTFVSLNLINALWAMIISQVILLVFVICKLNFKKLKCEKFSFYNKTALTIMTSLGLSILLFKIDILLIGIIGTFEDVARYEICAAIAFLLMMPFQALFKTSELSLKSSSYNNKKMIKNFDTGMLLALVIWLCIIIFSIEILYLFGSQYILGKNTLFILATGYLFAYFFGTVSESLLYNGYQKIVLFYQLVGIICCVLFGYILFDVYGLNGVAIAFSSSLILVKWLLLCYCRKQQLNFSCLQRSNLLTVIFVVTNGVIISFLPNVLKYLSFIILIIWILYENKNKLYN